MVDRAPKHVRVRFDQLTRDELTSLSLEERLRTLLEETKNVNQTARTLCDEGYSILDVQRTFSEEGYPMSIVYGGGSHLLDLDGQYIRWVPAGEENSQST